MHPAPGDSHAGLPLVGSPLPLDGRFTIGARCGWRLGADLLRGGEGRRGVFQRMGGAGRAVGWSGGGEGGSSGIGGSRGLRVRGFFVLEYTGTGVERVAGGWWLGYGEYST